MLRVTFIHQSSFMVELNHSILLFDYFPATTIGEYTFGGVLPEIDFGKHLYVFVSHGHKDHFSPEIFSILGAHPNVDFIVSNDIKLKGREFRALNLSSEIKNRIHPISPRSKMVVGDATIETLRSTEEGVAFSVICENVPIYHAGDNHWWNFSNRGELYCEKYGMDYRKELRVLKERPQTLAFVVLDPRPEGFAYGMEEFLKSIPCEYVFPMHMWQDYDVIRRLFMRPDIAPYKDKIIEIDRENIVFDFEE